MKKRVFLKCIYGLGDNVVLTAAVRDLLAQHGDEFAVNVDSTFPDLWKNMPGLDRTVTRKRNDIAPVCSADMSPATNRQPYSYIASYAMELSRLLDVHIHVTEFNGLVLPDPGPHMLTETLGDTPFWLLNAGFKADIPLKGWPIEYYQEVVNRLKHEVVFVQVGSPGEAHAPIDGVVDLRGRTTIPDLVRLVEASRGVMCGITGLMHLAAAVPSSHGRRAAVILGGGRESPHFIQYPGHVFLNTVYYMDCCRDGGCWKSKIESLEPSDKDCPYIVTMEESGQRVAECMYAIRPSTVVDAVMSEVSRMGEIPNWKMTIPEEFKARDWDCACRNYDTIYPRWKRGN